MRRLRWQQTRKVATSRSEQLIKVWLQTGYPVPMKIAFLFWQSLQVLRGSRFEIFWNLHQCSQNRLRILLTYSSKHLWPHYFVIIVLLFYIWYLLTLQSTDMSMESSPLEGSFTQSWFFYSGFISGQTTSGESRSDLAVHSIYLCFIF